MKRTMAELIGMFEAMSFTDEEGRSRLWSTVVGSSSVS